jgi:hypothetical protein
METINRTSHFYCEICDYKCIKSKHYTQHILTQRHIRKQHTGNGNLLETINRSLAKCVCNHCHTDFRTRSGLWKHAQKCQETSLQTDDPPSSSDDVQIPTDIIMELIKQNQEFKQLLLDQNKQLYEKHEENIDLQKQLLEIVKDGKTITNNTISNSNNNNKTFNLQVFLNETCKDAMNMKDFIQSLQLNLTDLEKVGELGYAEGISRMFINGLNNLEVTKRPIHCSDVKREIMHIKDEDKWEKYNASQDKLKNIIRQITFKNIMLMDDWKEANPRCTEYNSRKYDHYLKLMLESMGPTDEVAEKRDFGKIIRRVAESTTIDKKYLIL